VTPVIIVQPAAQRDLAEIADYFAERSLKLALLTTGLVPVGA
jgi:hypothetical protein